jgi:hypothetical protein
MAKQPRKKKTPPKGYIDIGKSPKPAKGGDLMKGPPKSSVGDINLGKKPPKSRPGDVKLKPSPKPATGDSLSGKPVGVGGLNDKQAKIPGPQPATSGQLSGNPVRVGQLQGGKRLSSGPPAKKKTPVEKQQERADREYGKGTMKATSSGKLVQIKAPKGSGKSGGSNSRPSSKGSSKPTTPVKDEITQMIEAATQQSQRYTDYYNKQNEAIRSATTADSLKLAEAAGAMGTVAPVEYGSGSSLDAAANASGLGTYGNLVNAATSTAARNLSDASKAKIASGGAAQQRYFGGNRDVVNARNVEYLRALKASEPKLRREKQASDAKIALDQALAAYTQQNNLANLEIKKGQLALDGQRLDETIRNNNLSSADRAAARQQAVILAQIKATQGAAGKAGSSTAAQQKAVRSWVQANLYGTQNTKNDDGSQSQSTKVMLKNPYSKTIQEMSRYGFPKSETLKFAIAHDDGALKKDGPVNFYLAMNNMGVSSRASVSYLKQAGFKQKDIREIIKYKNNIPELIRKQAAGLLK